MSDRFSFMRAAFQKKEAEIATLTAALDEAKRQARLAQEAEGSVWLDNIKLVDQLIEAKRGLQRIDSSRRGSGGLARWVWRMKDEAHSTLTRLNAIQRGEANAIGEGRDE